MLQKARLRLKAGNDGTVTCPHQVAQELGLDWDEEGQRRQRPHWPPKCAELRWLSKAFQNLSEVGGAATPNTRMSRKG